MELHAMKTNPTRRAFLGTAGTVAAATLIAGSVLLVSTVRLTSAAEKDVAKVDASHPLRQLESFRFSTLRLAIEDLSRTYGGRYTDGPALLSRLSAFEQRVRQAKTAAKTASPWPVQRLRALRQEWHAFQRRAMLSNPAVQDLSVLCVKRAWRKRYVRIALHGLGIPSNHECLSSLPPLRFDNEIATFRVADPTGTWETLCRPADGGWVGDMDLHWDADRFIFAKSDGPQKSDARQWKLWEMNIDGSGLRQITHAPPDVDCFDACYLPDGRIVCASDATSQCVPCWHGVANKYVANLFVMNADGSDMRRITFDQDHDMHPAVLSNGQVVYNRWDYTGIDRTFLRPLMVMNPDGTGQRSLYGSNSWYPNGLYSPQELPGQAGKLLCILSGYHGPGRTGHLVVVDTNQGRKEADGIVKRISGRGLPLEVEYMDRLTTETWPKFHSSYPITDKHFLVSAWMSEDSRRIGIYLADIFDNVLLLHEVPNAALWEPIPVIQRKTPPKIPERTDPERDDAIMYLQDVYVGPGLAGVPRGTIKKLRVIAYHFGYVGLAGNDKIGLSGPWDAMRILGTTPVEEDGSAMFRIPADTPVAFQALDTEGKAVQLMRSWVSARPGETSSCVGCHENAETPPAPQYSVAASRSPRKLEPWYGRARGFDFAREVQPVLNKYCVSCHDGRDGLCDLRREELVPDYQGRTLGYLGRTRLREEHRSLHDGRVRHTPAYEALTPYIRRVNVGDEVNILTAGYYHADTSELIQLLQRGHHGVVLDKQAWDRLITWIDLNGPCHGTWRDVYTVPMPECADKRRAELFALYGGPADDPEWIPPQTQYDATPVLPTPQPKPQPVVAAGWPFDRATKRRSLDETAVRHLDLGGGATLRLVKIPAGRFVMGDADGLPDEHPLAPVEIRAPFWMSVCEISNEQLRRCLTSHDSGHYTKRHVDRDDDKGMVLNEPSQPALKVSWTEAMEFCRWLSERTGLDVSLPSEAQWEYACRAGSAATFHYGGLDQDFGRFENMADRTFATFGYKGKRETGMFQVANGIDYLVAEGVDNADRRFDDGACMTAPIDDRQANAFGVCDMHGNVAEWTLSLYRPYPYAAADGRNDMDAKGERVVRGGSYLDRPARCRSAARYSYPPWQKVYNVGFRIVVNQSASPLRTVREISVP